MNDPPTSAGHTVALDEALIARLRGLAQRCEVSPVTVVLAGFALLLRRYTGDQVFTVRCGDGSVRADLAEDRQVRDLCLALVLGPSASTGEFALRTGSDLAELTIDGVPTEYVADFLVDLVTLLAGLEPDKSTEDLMPITEYERRPAPATARLHGGDGRQADAVCGQTIPEAFATQVARHPDRPAVLADDASLTYRELGSAVAATAATIPPGKGPIAVQCRHGVPTITALLAALVAGDAYLPLDPVFPARRLALMLADAAARVVLTDAAHAELAGQLVALAGRPDLSIIHIRESTSDVDLLNRRVSLARLIEFPTVASLASHLGSDQLSVDHGRADHLGGDLRGVRLRTAQAEPSRLVAADARLARVGDRMRRRRQAQIGVFAGCGPNRYLHHHLLGNPAVRAGTGATAEDWDEALAGGGCDYLPARAAYALGLPGPAVAVQSACSTSLVAVCQAVLNLLDYRCDVAIAGGAAVMSTRQAGYRYRSGGTLAADGVCRPYDAAATGQVFGNGAGAVVLKRLADAQADGDHVHAVLAGWAVNNDGADRAGFTVPGVAGQAAVVAEALAAAGWDAADVRFVEGHGTGTAIGDAIEIEALTRARRGNPGPCLLGSLKANVGNLDAAAGVVALVKAVYAVRTGLVPPTLHFTGAHRDVDLAGSGFEVNTQTRVWPGPRRAGVSSFGVGGTNAHVLIEPAPSPVPSHRWTDPEPGWTVLPLSAADPAALRSLAARLAAHLAAAPRADALLAAAQPAHPPLLADVAHTLAVGRRRLAHRAVVLGRHPAEAVAGLTALANGEPVGVPTAAPDDVRALAAGWLVGVDNPVVDGQTGPGRRIPSPGYPFQRAWHWIEAMR